MTKTPEDHFSRIAAAYLKGRLGYPASLFDYLAGLCENHEQAWDCATGSGQAVPGLACRFKSVVATDISGELLAGAEMFPNVIYSKAPAESSGIDRSSVDLAIAAQALHWFDLQMFWAELRRILKPRGIFAFWGYTWPIVDARVDSLLDHFCVALKPFWPGRSSILHSEYRAVEPPFQKLATPPFEMSVAWTSADYLAHVQSWSAVRYCRERGREDIVADFQSRLTSGWSENERREARWPLHLGVFRCP
jgi:ubiquinone/menaquinone biosynthesis C-methylase UbiE